MLKPNPQCDDKRRWGFCEVIRSWGWSPHKWHCAPIREDPESTLVPSILWGYSEQTVIYEPGSGYSDTESASCIILDFPVSRTVRNKLFVVKVIQCMVFLLHQADIISSAFFFLESRFDVQSSENYFSTMSYITRKSQSLTLNFDASTSYLQISCCDEIKTLVWVNAVVKLITRAWLFWTTWTIARQDPLSMGFPRQGYWNGLLFPSPGVLSDPGVEPLSPALAAGFLTAEPFGKPS